MDRLSQRMNRLEQWGFSGAVLVARGDKILLEAGYGWAGPDERAPVDAETIFDIGSLAKQYTAAAILLLQDQGRLSVRDTLAIFLPEAPSATAGITLHQLLTHTSGLPREVGRDWEVMDRPTFERQVLSAELLFAPGNGWSYSNAGYALLGALIERVSGTPFHDFLEREVFVRAGLRRTGFIGRSPDPGHTARAAGGSTSGQNPADWTHTWNHRGSGGMLATAGDVLRWRRALLAGRVISPAAVTAMHTPHRNGYGYGLQVSETDSRVQYSHTGLWYSFSSRFVELPADSVIIVALSNRLGDGFLPATVAARDLADDLFGRFAPLPPALSPGTSPPPTAAGRYRTASGETVHVTIDGDHLRVTGKGQEIFSTLFSDTIPSTEILDLIHRRSVAILLGVRDGGFDTLDVAAPPARAQRYRRLLPPIWAARQDSLGRLSEVEVVGVIDRGEALDLVAELRFARGVEGVALTWSREGMLLALANENPALDETLTTFRPTPDGSFAAWHFQTRTTVRLRIAGDSLRASNEATGRTIAAKRSPG